MEDLRHCRRAPFLSFCSDGGAKKPRRSGRPGSGKTEARILIEGGMCVFAYYSKLPYIVEMTGLTQYSLAQLPLAERGSVGHEKTPTEAWLNENDVHLILSQTYPYVAPEPGKRRHDEIFFSNLARAKIRVYVDEIMDALRSNPEVSFVPIEAVIQRLELEMAGSSIEDGQRIYDYLDAYYLRHNGRRGQVIAARLRNILAKKGKPLN